MCSIESLNEVQGPDFRVASFDGWTLSLESRLTGYPDAWHAKLNFRGVSFLDCPIEFSHAVFRRPTAGERAAIAAKTPVEEEQQIIAIDAETMAGLEPQAFFIVCETVSTVFHHE